MSSKIKNGQKIPFLPVKSKFWDQFYFVNFKSWRSKSGLRILIFQVKSWFLGHFWFRFFQKKIISSKIRNGLKIHFLLGKLKFWDHFYFFNFKSWRKESGVRIFILLVKSGFLAIFWKFDFFQTPVPKRSMTSKISTQILLGKPFLYSGDLFTQVFIGYEALAEFLCYRYHPNGHCPNWGVNPCTYFF